MKVYLIATCNLVSQNLLDSSALECQQPLSFPPLSVWFYLYFSKHVFSYQPTLLVLPACL